MMRDPGSDKQTEGKGMERNKGCCGMGGEEDKLKLIIFFLTATRWYSAGFFKMATVGLEMPATTNIPE